MLSQLNQYIQKYETNKYNIKLKENAKKIWLTIIIISPNEEFRIFKHSFNWTIIKPKSEGFHNGRHSSSCDFMLLILIYQIDLLYIQYYRS